MQRLASPVLIVAAVCYGFFLQIAALAGLLGFWLGSLLLLSLWRYSYAVLTGAAQGRLELPVASVETMSPVGDWRLIAHFIAFPAVVTVLLYVRPFGADGFGAVLSWTAVLAVACVFPASAAMMALTRSLEAAFNPADLWRVAAMLGRDYARLVAACCAIVLGAFWLRSSVPGGLAGSLAGNVVTVWAVLAVFVSIGMMLRAHRHDFAVPGEREPAEERAARLQRAEWRHALDAAYGSIRSGLVDEGYTVLRRLVAEQRDSLEIHYWLLDQMLAWEDRSHALAVGRRLIDLHLADGEHYAALDVLTRCRRAAREFAVSPDAAAPLAEYARTLGHHGVADELESPAAARPETKTL